ncbi:polysaccharide biosynthesis protein [Ruminococcaceae bacterium OttesenSCG-928-N02]|nr:polysaccharide biosynthesis protein [Ruminococcaceae bacterium OttesenSCG-928-N02]
MKNRFLRTIQRSRKQLLLCFDILIIIFSYMLTWMLIAGRADMRAYTSLMVASCFLFVCCYAVVYGFMGMYDSLWRYAEIVEFFRFCVAAFLAVLAFVITSLLIYTERRIPISVYMMSAMFASMFTLVIRLVYRMYRNTKIEGLRARKKRVLLIGAGDAASTLLHELGKNPDNESNVICAVDDDPSKQGRIIMGVQIMGTTVDIPRLVEQCEIETILLAIPSLDSESKKRILSICAKTNCNLQVLPDIVKLIAGGQDFLARVQDVRVEDLLGRPEIQLTPATSELIMSKVVLVTGGGGSIGSELCRQIAACHPAKLIILDIYENNAYAIQQELLRIYGENLHLEVHIASVRDTDKVNRLFERYCPQLVFHAAAHKHVPLMEYAPEEAVKNNVFGTYNVAKAAMQYGAQRFVLISTDKAVNPTNVMGATKRICEMVVQTLAQSSPCTEFVAVRFGNVLGSNGSVLPLFKEQVANGGPVTVTHPDIVRYFMTIPESVRLVLEAAAMGVGGNIYVLDMGDPVKILDLAENLIKFVGLTPYKDINIIFTGLRPGEKLYEELLMDEEGLKDTANAKIHVGAPLRMDEERFFDELEELHKIAERNDGNSVVKKLLEIVPTFHHDTKEERY